MMTLIIGTPDSGKSLLAEQICQDQAGATQKYYIATMIPFGEEGKKRVEKHRSMREGKGFITLEWPDDLLSRIRGEHNLSGSAVLLECMSNLVGNEMYKKENAGMKDDELIQKIIAGVKMLNDTSAHLVVVTNEFPAEDPQYDEETKRYVRMTAGVNQELTRIADTYYMHRNGEWKQYAAY